MRLSSLNVALFETNNALVSEFLSKQEADGDFNLFPDTPSMKVFLGHLQRNEAKFD